MKDAETDGQNSVLSFSYVGGPNRGDHCLIDVDKVAVPCHDCASVPDPLDLPPEKESAFFEG